MSDKPTTPDQLEQFEQAKAAIASEAQRQAEVRYVNKLNGLYQESSSAKEVISKNWLDYTAFLRGEQWPSRRPTHKVSAVLNFMLENVERKTALLTDAKPIPKVTPKNDRYQDDADVLNGILRFIFDNSEFEQANTEMVEYGQVFGSGFMSALRVQDTPSDIGDISVVAHDPRAVYIDPMVLRSYLLCKGEYTIIEDLWPLEKAKDLYPKRADLILPDDGLSMYQTNASKPSFLSRFTQVFRAREDNVAKSEIPRVHMREFWLRDRSGRFEKNSRKTMLAGNVIADDGSNPYSDGEFPQEMFTWHTDFHSAWGWGDVELLKNPQQIQNKIMASMVENMALMSNAIWIGDADALSKEDWAKLTNAPGSYIKKKPGRELRREPGVPFPDYILRMLEYVGISKDTMTGMVDVMRGIRTGQVSSGVGIESLQLMGQALIRLRSRAVESLQSRIGRKLVSRVYQYMKPEQIKSIILQQAKGTELKEVSSELLKPIANRSMDWQKRFIFSIEPGSSLGLAKTQKRIESMRLREMGDIDRRALLEDLEYPHREAVMERLKEEEAEMAEQQAQQKGAGSKATQFPMQANASPAGRA